LLLGGEARRLPRARAVAERGLAPFPSTLEPLAHRTRGDAKGGGDLALFPTLLGQFPGPEAAAFLPGDRFVLAWGVHGEVLPNLHIL
jgi:hypothetical protein